MQKGGITEAELHQAKSKILSRVVRGSERPMGRMQAIAAAWTYTGEYRDVDTELANFEAVTRADIRAYLDAYPIDKDTVVAFGPLKELNGASRGSRCKRCLDGAWRRGREGCYRGADPGLEPRLEGCGSGGPT